MNLPSLFAAADAPEEEGEDDEEEKEEVADASLPISQPSSKELYKELITSSSSEHPLAVKSWPACVCWNGLIDHKYQFW